MCKWGNTVPVEVGEREIIHSIDRCIAPIVDALNKGGIKTVASCCGHGKRPGNIALADGRELVVCLDYETGRMVDAAFPAICEETESP